MLAVDSTEYCDNDIDVEYNILEELAEARASRQKTTSLVAGVRSCDHSNYLHEDDREELEANQPPN